MIGVFFLLGLSFLVELTFGSSIQTLACRSKLPTSLSGSFLNGALATLVATPCTGPFMGSALAATITLPAFHSLLIFTTLGLGMSSPYLLLAFRPSLLKRLPRPGEWTITFRQLMAFPLFASAIWLLRVFGRQVGLPSLALGALIDILWGMLACGFGFWVLSRTAPSRSAAWKKIGTALCWGSILLGLWIAYPRHLDLDSQDPSPSASTNGSYKEKDRFGLLWERFSDTRLDELLSQGQPVYIDFTAEWCITCQVNERVVFGSSTVRDALGQKKVALLKGDWTSMDPSITKALERFGRNGVPLNVFYSGLRGADSKPQPPVILPNILTPGVVLAEVMKLP
jgi:thiol:disulfide interchange protein